MATDLAVNLKLDGNARIVGAAGLIQPSVPLLLGQGNWPEMKLALTYGAGNNQAKQWWADERTVAAGANDDLDLAGVLVSPINEVITATAIKLLLIALKDPDGTKALRVGPQALAAAIQGPWGGVAATDYTEVKNWCPVINAPWGGYPIVAGTTDKLRIANPGAGPVTYRVLAAFMTA